MKRKTFARMNCSIARALELVGEWWTMLILREAFLGTRRFRDFQRNLGIARNILSARLKKLVTRGILERSTAAGGGRRLEYRLTEKGRAFFPVLMALMQWGDRYAACPGGPPVRVVDRHSGEDIADICVTDHQGRRLRASDVAMVPGPGAGPSTKARFGSTSEHNAVGGQSDIEHEGGAKPGETETA
ncbi:MAG TPA: helix-turn-helix domain-containing protein [Candidatus Binataceae bacterium]|nr:helix-turn-helix domain-containing protein [Candidatus Binataceae bacterium]